MGSYDNALKKMHRYDSIKKEVMQWERLLSSLVISEEDFATNYASHADTGIVYDIRIIQNKVKQLTEELNELEEYS